MGVVLRIIDKRNMDGVADVVVVEGRDDEILKGVENIEDGEDG